jgi:hypothetical protein
MDFSLLQPQARNFCLRDILALKSRWPYYAVMVIDPILRFSWIFYAIFTHNVQHSTIVAFLVALMEVCRRAVWVLFRVENEHCANVAQYKASRDVPLPYRIEPLITANGASEESSPVLESAETRLAQHRSSARPQSGGDDLEGSSTAVGSAVQSSAGTFRRRVDAKPARSFSKVLAEAHRQDFEKKRRPADQGAEVEEAEHPSDDDDDDEEDDEVAAGAL